MKRIQDDYLVDLTPFERPIVMHFYPQLPEEVRRFLIQKKQRQAVQKSVDFWKRGDGINLQFEYPPLEAKP